MPNWTPETPAPGTLAERLRRMAELKTKADGSTYSQQEIAEGASQLYREHCLREAERAGAPAEEIAAIKNERPLVTRSYVNGLVAGRSDNPTRVIIEYLAKFLGVTPSYFFEVESGTGSVIAEVEEELATLETIRELKLSGHLPDLLALGRSAQVLSPDVAAAVLKLALAHAQTARGVAKPESSGSPEGR